MCNVYIVGILVHKLLFEPFMENEKKDDRIMSEKDVSAQSTEMINLNVIV